MHWNAACSIPPLKGESNILCWGNLPFRQTDRLIDTQRTMLLLQRPGMQQA